MLPAALGCRGRMGKHARLSPACLHQIIKLIKQIIDFFPGCNKRCQADRDETLRVNNVINSVQVV